MIVIHKLPLLPYHNITVTLIDAGITVILIFPVLYFVSIRPLLFHIDKRQQAEKAVKAEQQRFNDILETLPGYIVLLTPDYQVPFANRFFRERFGEAHGRRCYEYLFGRDQPCEICETYKVLNTMKPGRWEWTGPDGHIYDVYDFPFKDANGLTVILEMGIDITEQKRTMQDLVRATELQNRFFDSIDVHIAYMDRNFNFIRVNNAYAKADGHVPEFFVGKNHFALYPNRENQEIFQRVVETGIAFSVYEKPFEYPEHPERGITYWDWNLQPVMGLDGVVEGVVLSLLNVTERVRAQQELEERANEWKETFNAISEFVSVHDHDFKILRANQALADYLGKTPQELIGKHCYELFHKSDKPWHNCPHAMAMKSKHAVTQEVHDPQIGCPLLISVSPIFDRNGRVAGGVHIAKDITRQKVVEKRLHSLSRRLVEIQENERLYIARELHDEAGQMLTSLMLDLVTLETLAYQPESVLKKVAEMQEALNAVSENLHNVAMALRPATLDHLGLVPALRQYLDSIGGKYKLKVSFESGNFQERLPARIETELYRIVQEALTNVVRHAHASRIDVVLNVRDNKLIVMIEDDGNGFDPENVPDTGHLGLFGMRERAEMIAGQLVIESKPGKGTTVMVEVDCDQPVVNYR